MRYAVTGAALTSIGITIAIVASLIFRAGQFVSTTSINPTEADLEEAGGEAVGSRSPLG